MTKCAATYEHDPDWRALKAEIEQAVILEPTPITLGERELTWYRVTNPDVLLEHAVEVDGQAEPELVDPFWAATWRAAQGLDRFLASLDLKGQRVLELGCGSGQAGVGAALRGAEVVATDAVELALDVARLNAWLAREQMDFQRLVWNRQPLPTQAFPIIIGSDLVYDPGLFEALEACARQHLAAEGRLLLSEPYRHSGDKFSRWIRDAGWDVEEHQVHLQDGRVPIRIFDCQLPPAIA